MIRRLGDLVRIVQGGGSLGARTSLPATPGTTAAAALGPIPDAWVTPAGCGQSAAPP